MSGQIIAFVTFCASRDIQERYKPRTGREFMVTGGREIRLAEALENSKVIICGWRDIETLIGGGTLCGPRRMPIKKVCGSGKCLSPKGSWHVSLKEECTHDVVDGAEGSLGLVFLG